MIDSAYFKAFGRTFVSGINNCFSVIMTIQKGSYCRFLFSVMSPMILVVSSLFIFGTSSCVDTVASSGNGNALTFSADTVKFDTVFTSIGSVTNKLLVYNKTKSDIEISSISIGNGKNSFFKVNVDGATSADNQFKNIRLRANDSIYVFVSVTVNPNSTDNPLLVDDSLSFTCGSTRKRVILNAIGQNVTLLKNIRITTDSTLTSTRPFLIMGDLTVDSLKTLTIGAGCKLYFHSKANLIVHGNLVANGTFEKPIWMRGDRLDNIKFATPFPYNNIWGQWGGIYLKGAGRSHVLQHVFINGDSVGIKTSNSNINKTSSLKIEFSRIHNCTINGLKTENFDLDVSNTEISNTGSYCVYIKGGKHSFVHCTIANYFNSSNLAGLIKTYRDRTPALLIMNMERCVPMESNFQNCIITGSIENEFSLATLFADTYNGNFESNYIKRTAPITSPQFKNIKWSAKNDTIFKVTYYDYEKAKYFDFTLDSLSKARGIADKIVASKYPLDLMGNDRTKDNSPDMGAYQWMPHK
jgi:hypothetical protein